MHLFTKYSESSFLFIYCFTSSYLLLILVPNDAERDYDEIYIGQRVVNVAWIETAVKFCVKSHLESYFDDLCIGPLQASQFVARFCCMFQHYYTSSSLNYYYYMLLFNVVYMQHGLPKIPKLAKNCWENFFGCSDGLLQMDADQYFFVRPMIGNDGKMTEPVKSHPLKSDMNDADRKKTEKCLLCVSGLFRLITSIRDVHAPDFHTWKGRTNNQKECPQCRYCGFPEICFTSDSNRVSHMEAHQANFIANASETYLDVNETGNIDGEHTQHHPFQPNFTGL